MIDKIQKIRKAFQKSESIFQLAVLDNQAEILDANTAQLEVGKDSFGVLLWEYASDEYAQFKQSIGSKAPFGIADLKLTGDFYSGFILKKQGKEFTITSTDSKTNDLVAKYGSEIFGLSDDQFPTVKPLLIDSFTKHMKDAMLR